MKVTPLDIPAVKLIYPSKHVDDRGFFSETYKKSALFEGGIDCDFIQDNHAFSAAAGTVRGLHFQTPPFHQAKLVRVISGAILDVAVDVRTGSPTFGKFISVVISARDWNQIFIPVGFAHGLLTLEPDTEVLYKVTAEYSAGHDRGVRWNDPAIGIDWGTDEDSVILSDKDKLQPMLAELPDYFVYEEPPAR